ncbi:hypothetical protein FB108_2557 [Brevibacterium jeotgali]|nr:hypothetical protein FB108_2557 [Brevibacterium jeotgali]
MSASPRWDRLPRMEEYTGLVLFFESLVVLAGLGAMAVGVKVVASLFKVKR